jgi:hypothetical protein
VLAACWPWVAWRRLSARGAFIFSVQTVLRRTLPSSLCKSFCRGTSKSLTLLSGIPLTIRSHSNAEAGLALICTCLPAFVAQFRHLESAVRYGSSRSRNEITSEGNKAEFQRSFAFGTSRTDCGTDSALWSDEVELVSNAQGRSANGGDDGSHKGILRKTEVTHVVTYAIEEKDENKSSRASDRS